MYRYLQESRAFMHKPVPSPHAEQASMAKLELDVGGRYFQILCQFLTSGRPY
jgi:hypothetical protein